MIFDSAGAQNSPERPRPQRDSNVSRLRLIPLIPPSEVKYTVISADEKIKGRLGFPAAKLIDVPPDLNEIAIWTPPTTQAPTFKPDDIAYELISSVRYRGSGKELVIATYRLSSAAAKLQRFFGRSENLPDGTLAGIEILEQGNYPYRVVFERGNFIIVVAGNLSIDEIKQLAATAQLK